MARRSQCSSAGDNPLDPNYLPPHYREEYRLAIDALIEDDLEGYYQFLHKADVVDFLSTPEIDYIQSSVQVPQQSRHPEQQFLESGADGSSDTYWPIHSDLDVPGLDLGWPQLHHFIEPAEVTTLVNPPEPNMPSIKDQARRLIKNARQVIAVVMDMFTDVDMFADIINAASRNVAVYILLDEQNAHHFLNMVSNCRVNLQSIQFLRVRTLSGITYQCRSGKSFKGQVMNRFLLTDCRAVLSGNYSFMWSFEKLHRSMAHLFLGQLVSTFDEEFRILFAQSQPLMTENVLTPTEDLSLLRKRQYAGDRTSLYREPRPFLSTDTGHPDEWARQSCDEGMEGDWRLMPHKRQEYPGETYSRFPSQQSRMDPSFDKGPSKMMENLAFKRHSYAEGVPGRYSFPLFQQQGMPDSESQGRHFHRGQQPYPAPGPEADYNAYDKFWNQGYQSADQYSEPGLPQEMQRPDNFDPVFNYLSSTRNLDFDQSSEKLSAADLPSSSSHPRRSSLGQPYVCQTSPPPTNPADQKQFFQEPNIDRKDPMVKRGLRNWRICSYLSGYENPEDEGLPQTQASDPFEEPSNPVQQTAPGIDFSVPKIPNVREFKVPAIPRASQIPNYAKTTAREQPKKLPNESATVAEETKITPTPSESSSTTEGEKTEEVEQREPKAAVLRRDDSFRRKYNAAVPRSSRLRTSLIFSSLDQQHTPQDTKTAPPDQQEEESDKNEAAQTKLPFVSHVLGQRRSAAREPFEWSRYTKSATFDNTSIETSKQDDGSSKADDKDSLKELTENPDAPESLKLSSEAELPKPDLPVRLPKPLVTGALFVDMDDADMRLMFFKELAAKRRADKAAEAEKSKEKAQMKPTADLKSNTEEPVPKETSENTASTFDGLLQKKAAAESAGKTESTEACESVSPTSDASGKTNKQDSLVQKDSSTSQSYKAEQTKVSTDSETVELKNSQSAVILPVSAEAEAPQSKSPEEPNLSNPSVKESSPSHPPTPTNTTPANVSCLAQVTNEGESRSLDSTSKESKSVTPSSAEVTPNTQNRESVQLETSICSPPLPSEQDTGPEQGSSSDHTLLDSGSQSSLSSSSAPPSTTGETASSNIAPEDSTSTPASNISSPNVDKTEAQESVSASLQESSKSAEETSQKSENLCNQAHPDSVSQLAPSETSSTAGISADPCAAGSEPDTSSLQSNTEPKSEEFSAATPSAKESEEDISQLEKDVTELEKAISESVKDENKSEKDVSESEVCSLPKAVAEESEDAKADSTSHLDPSAESGLTSVSGSESSASNPDSEETPIPIPANTPPEEAPSETSSPVNTDFTANASQSETTASPQDAPTQAALPSVSCSSPEAKKTDTNISALQSLSGTNSLSSETPSESDKPPVHPSANSPSSPNEPTLKLPAEVDVPCKTPESVSSENHTSEPPVPAENSEIEPESQDTGEKKSDDTEDTNKLHKSSTQESVCSDKTNDQVIQNDCSEPAEVPPKQSISGQSRYQSSTANVLSSSNLRDDTKILLEQISANSQTRNEATKEAPVTDDEKEDKADKKAKREKERGIGTFGRAPPKSTEEREKLLERMQSLRKERKVYSRFEMAP